MQFSVAIRNARLNQIEVVIGQSPKLQIFTGPVEADCTAADTGTKLLDMILPIDWMSDAVDAIKAKSGIWSGPGLVDGQAGHFRIKDALDVCHMQGVIAPAGDGGIMIIDNVNILLGEVVTINRFALTDGNA